MVVISKSEDPHVSAFKTIVALIKVDKNLIMNTHDTVRHGGFWHSDRWQYNTTIVSLEDEGATLRIFDPSFKLNVSWTDTYLVTDKSPLVYSNGDSVDLMSLYVSISHELSKQLSVPEYKKTLGQVLHDSIEREKIERVAQERTHTLIRFDEFIVKIKNEITSQIMNGEINPSYEVVDGQQMMWMAFLYNQKPSTFAYCSEFKDKWDTMIDYFREEGIGIEHRPIPNLVGRGHNIKATPLF